MAKRRRIGQALQNMSAQTNQFLEILLRQQMEKERMAIQAKNAEADDARAADAAKFDQQNSLRTLFGQNPVAARASLRAGEKPLGIDPAHFAPSDDEMVGGIHEDIAKTTDRGALPSVSEVMGRTRAAGVDPKQGISGNWGQAVPGMPGMMLPTNAERTPIDSLLASRVGAEKRISIEDLRKIREGKRYSETEGREVVGPEGATTPLGPTPTQAGANARTTALEGEFHPDIIKANARKAGAQSYASGAGSAGGSIDAQYARRGRLSAIADAQQGSGGGAGGRLPAVIQERVAAADAALYGIDRVRELFPQVQNLLGPISGRWESAKNKLPGLEGNPVFAEFEAQVTGVKNTIIKYYTGAQMSEPEAIRLAAQVGEITNKPEVFPIKMRVLEANMKEMRRRMIETAMGRQLGPFQFAPDPTDPNDPLAANPSQQIIRWVPPGARR